MDNFIGFLANIVKLLANLVELLTNFVGLLANFVGNVSYVDVFWVNSKTIAFNYEKIGYCLVKFRFVFTPSTYFSSLSEATKFRLNPLSSSLSLTDVPMSNPRLE